MENKIFIGEFVKLTRSTLKTVLYYHKIGLLKEPKRSHSGYRLYGPEELFQMRMIKHLKKLGLDLKQIKEILEKSQNNITMKEALKSLHTELLNEKERLDNQILRVENLLNLENEELEKTSVESNLFKVVTETLEPEQLKDYKELYPELYDQQRNVFGVIDDFKWGNEYKDNFAKIAEYFKLNPEKHKIALELGKRLSKLKQMSEDDPEIEELAKDGAEFIINEPILKDMLYGQVGLDASNENLFNEMSNKFLSPAQIKHKELIQKHLKYKTKNNK